MYNYKLLKIYLKIQGIEFKIHFFDNFVSALNLKVTLADQTPHRDLWFLSSFVSLRLFITCKPS